MDAGGSHADIVTEYGTHTIGSLAECSAQDFIAAIQKHAPPCLRLAVIGLPAQIVNSRTGLRLARTQHKFAKLAGIEGGLLGLEEVIGAALRCRTLIRQDGVLTGYGALYSGDVDPSEIAYFIGSGTSVSGCPIIYGRPIEEPHSVRLSHLILDPSGRPCSGENHAGCVKQFLSRCALEDLAERNGLPRDLPAVSDLARGGDDRALSFYLEFGQRLARCMAAIAAVLPLHAFVLGGGIGLGSGALLVNPALGRFRSGAFIDAEVAGCVELRITRSENAVVDGCRYLAR